jgi:SAM-dependent methyltransferase
MTQNIYDSEEFFTNYSRLPRSVRGLDGAPEWPSIRALLPEVRGLNVVDLGCGFGWFCRWARENGAAEVLGVDVSENMLTRARAETHDPAITYQRTDLETLALPPALFGLAYSSLTLHYIENLDPLFSEIYRALTPGGAFVFSVEHPTVTAPRHPDWLVNASGGKTWPVDGYLDEGPRTTDWLTKGVVKQHRMIATYINLLLRTGFSLRGLEEWGPSHEQVAAHPEWAANRECPPFLLMAAIRR